MESPRGLRDPSLGNLGTVLKQADLVVNLGKRVDFTVGFGKPQSIGEGTRWINITSVQHEQDRAKKNLGPSLVRAIMADPRDVVGALSAIDASKPDVSGWRDFVATELAQRSFPEIATDHITSQDLCQAVQDQIADHHDTAVICDGGEFGQWASAVTQAQSRIVNGISGAIGGGLCYGFAARLARPDALIFALMGDGSAGFHFAEFETAVRNNMHCVVVIGNDKRWNAEHLIQMRDYGPDRVFGCDLSDARYDLAAQALGAHGEYVTQLSELAPALRRAIDSKKPACVNVMIQGTPAPSGTSH
jgi:acetolactate synthase-1/2/3 large subunit